MFVQSPKVIFAFDGFELNAERFELRRNGRVLKLDSPVLRLLVALVRRADQLVLKDELVEEVWEGRAVADNVITVAMARLRKILRAGDANGQFITTAYGRGYRFVRPVSVLQEPLAAPTPRSAGAAEPPFVGRGQLLARLQAAVADARMGNGRFCALMGEAGIGKSHIVDVLERKLSGSDVRIAWAYCRELGQTPPLWPFQQALSDLHAPEEFVLPDTRATHGSTQRFHFSDAPIPDARSKSNEPDASARHQTFKSILQAFARFTEHAPLLLVLDDLDRADLASLELLSLLVDRVGRTRLLILATLRTDPSERPSPHASFLSQILGHRNCERILLERLTPADVTQYVSALLRDRDGALSAAVYEKSEGNPFFMAELSRQLLETSTPRPEALAVPHAALDLVRQRVAKLDENARGLLSTCAVIGRSFELRLLAEITGQPASQLMCELDCALSAGVLTLAESGKTRFVFSHELLRTVLYESLPAHERRAQHLLTAEALERRRAASDPIADSELAFHFHASLPTGDLRKTVRYCRAAADAAVSILAYADVSRHNKNALEALSLMDKPSVRLRMNLLYLASIYSRPQDPASYLSCTHELIRLGREHEDGEMLVRAGALLHAHPLLRPLAGVSSTMERGLSLLHPSQRGLRALGLAGLAGASPASFDAIRCEALVHQAVELAQAANSRGASYVALSMQLHLVGGPADPEKAARLHMRLEALAQQNPVELAPLPIDLAFHAGARALATGDLPRAETALDRATVRAKEIQHEELIWYAERALTLIALARGEENAAHEKLRRLAERAQRHGLFGVDLFTTYDRIMIFRERALGLEEERATARTLRYDAEDPPAFWALKLYCLSEVGLVDEARSALRAVPPERLALLPCDTHYLGTLAHLTRAAVRLGEHAYYAPLRSLLERYSHCLAANLFTGCEGSVSRFTAMLSSALDPSADVQGELEQAAQSEEQWGLLRCALETQRYLERVDSGAATRPKGRRTGSLRPRAES